MGLLTSSSVGVGGELTNAAKWYLRVWKPISDALLARLGDQSWIAPTFTNSWSNVSGSPAGYRNTAGVVRLRGVISGGTIATMFTLPVGYRPSTDHMVMVTAGSGVVRIDVLTTGEVVPRNGYINGGSNSAVSLDGILFPLN